MTHVPRPEPWADVPPIMPTTLVEVADVVGATGTRPRRKAGAAPTMSATEISRRAADFVELRESGLLRRRT